MQKIQKCKRGIAATIALSLMIGSFPANSITALAAGNTIYLQNGSTGSSGTQSEPTGSFAQAKTLITNGDNIELTGSQSLSVPASESWSLAEYSDSKFVVGDNFTNTDAAITVGTSATLALSDITISDSHTYSYGTILLSSATSSLKIGSNVKLDGNIVLPSTDSIYLTAALTNTLDICPTDSSISDGTAVNISGSDSYTMTASDAAKLVCTRSGYYFEYHSDTGTITLEAGTKLTSGNTTISDIADQDYTGNALTPSLTVTCNSTTLIEGTDYNVTYSDNSSIGTATATITGIGNYGGTLQKTFQIIPRSEDIYMQKNATGTAGTASSPVGSFSAAKSILKNGYNIHLIGSNGVIFSAQSWDLSDHPDSTFIIDSTYSSNCLGMFGSATITLSNINIQNESSTLKTSTYGFFCVNEGGILNLDENVTLSNPDGNSIHFSGGSSSNPSYLKLGSGVTINGTINNVGTGSYNKIQVSAPLTSDLDISFDSSVLGDLVNGVSDMPVMAASGYTLTASDVAKLNCKNTGYYFAYDSSAGTVILKKGTKMTADNTSISDITDQDYTGTNITPSLTVACNGTTLTKGTDYTVSYTDNKSIGTATATITGIGAYSGSLDKSFQIISGDSNIYLKTGSSGIGTYLNPTGTFTDAKALLTDGKDIQMIGTDNYQITGNQTWSLSDFPNSAFVMGSEFSTYFAAIAVTSGSSLSLSDIHIADYNDYLFGSIWLVANDSSLNIGNNVQVDGSIAMGTTSKLTISSPLTHTFDIAVLDSKISSGTTMHITGADGYTITASDVNHLRCIKTGYYFEYHASDASVTIEKGTLLTESNTVVSDILDQDYTGSALTPAVTVTCDDIDLVAERDYTATYSSNTDIGTATITINGIGAYAGTLSKTFDIVAKEANVYWSASGTGSAGNKSTPVGTFATAKARLQNGENITYIGNSPYTPSYSESWSLKDYPDSKLVIDSGYSPSSSTQRTMAILNGSYQKDRRSLTLSDISIANQGGASNGVLTAQSYADITLGNNTTISSPSGYSIALNGTSDLVKTPNILKIGSNVTLSQGIYVKSYQGNSIQVTSALTSPVKVYYTEDDLKSMAVGKIAPVTAVDGYTLTQSDMDQFEVMTKGYHYTYDSSTHSAVAKFGTMLADYTTTITDIPDKTYTGSAITPSLTVSTLGTTLTAGTDYTATYSSNTDAGTATVTITGTNPNVYVGYNGSMTKTFRILPRSITNASISTSSISDQSYTGSELTPAITVKDGSTTLTKDKDYTITYNNNTEPGQASVTVTGIGNYTGSVDKTFNIVAKDLSGSSVSVSNIADQTYTGTALSPAVSVTYGDTTLTEGTDYALSYVSNVNAGEATVTITGTGTYYTGSISKEFNIIAKSLSDSSISIETIADQVYSGYSLTPTITVKDNSSELTGGQDYTVSYTNNVNAGTATVTISGTGNYSGDITKTFYITPVSIRSATISSISDKVYTGKALQPALTVKLGGTTLKNGTDYTAAYSSNTDPGSAAITIKGIGNYTGSLTKSFNIIPKKQTLTSLKNTASKKITVNWSIDTKVDGYQIRYCKSSSFKSGVKTVGINKFYTTSASISKLTKGKKYYVQIRAYKTINKKAYYGAWSSTKSAKINK